MTGWAEDLDDETTAGVEVVFAKPFTRETLFEAIARAVPDRVRN